MPLALSLPWPFDTEQLQLGLAAGLVVGASAPLLGAFLVQRRLSLVGDGIGHVAFAGVAAGLVLGVAPLWSALVLAVAGAVMIEWLRARRFVTGDLALAIFFYGGIATGAVLLGEADGHERLEQYLFGSIDRISAGDVWTAVGLAVALVVAVGVGGRALLATVLDEESARVSGLPVDLLGTTLSVLTAVTVVVAMQVVGLLLVAALMVLPVATSRLVARSFRATMLGAVAVGVGSVVVGLTVARAGSIASGGTIVLTTVAAFAAVALTRGGRRALRQQTARTEG